MSKSKIIALIALITALLLMPVTQAWAVDYDGPEDGNSLIGAVRLNPEASYVGVPELLEKYIKEGDEAAWREIKKKIDYTYRNLEHALDPVLSNGKLKKEIKAQIKAGKKLFLKPNLVWADVLSLSGDGSPGSTSGAVACTEWAFVAALMRFFHDELGIRYYQMAVGEAGMSGPFQSALLGCPPEALMEGTPFGAGAGFWAGWPFYFVRKYLQECGYDPNDDPMSGYMDGIQGNYVTPGEATAHRKLVVYNLSNAESFDRGRFVNVPGGGGNYDEIVLHKALVGDPDDAENYPGCVLVNCPILKTHSLTTLTNAIKNLGIGGWPMQAGHDEDPDTYDWRYSYPPDSPPACKGGVPGPKDEYGEWKGHGVIHQRWYLVDANEEGMPLEISDTPSLGLDGTMVDINLAIKSQVQCMLHVVDAVKVIDLDHTGTGNGVAREEGLILASEDPVALDLLCARYMFKNLPRDPNSPDMFARGVPIPRYDETYGAIVTDPGVDLRLLRSTLFDYAAGRGLGKLIYYVEGKDKASRPAGRLVSKDGHFGRIEGGRFVDIMTDQLYFSIHNTLWDLQPTMLAYAEATDDLTGSTYYADYTALDEDVNGYVDDLELGTNAAWDCVLAAMGRGIHLIGKGEVNHGYFLYASRFLKHADPAWNVGSGDWLKVILESMAAAVALQMANGPEAMDPFFGIPYGIGQDGMPKWPSLQFARYGLEIVYLYDFMYANAAATGKVFELYVPPGYKLPETPGVVELDPADPNYAAKVFTAEFEDGTVW